MTNTEVIRVTQAADLLSIPATQADILLIFDRDTILPNGTLPFPANPINWQTYTLSTKSDITNFGADTGGKAINGVPATLPTGVTGWVYLLSEDEWFVLDNPPISNGAQAALNTKLSATGNGSQLTNLSKGQVGLGNVDNTNDASKPISSATQNALDGKQPSGSYLAPNGNGSGLTNMTASQVGLGNVNNTADSAKPVSSAQQAALDTKLGIGTIANLVYSRVIGSNATTTGQVLVAVTGLQNALEANAVYEFEAIMSCSTSAVTTGIGYGVQFSAAGATVEANIVGASSTTAAKAERINALNTTTTAFLATSAQHGGIRIKGIITTGANPGNLTIQHRKITSGTSTVFINSLLRTIRIA